MAPLLDNDVKTQVKEVFKDLVLVDVQFVADCRKFAVPDLFAVEGVQEGESHSAALGNDPDPTAAKDVLHGGERCGQPVRGIHDSDAIGADEPYAVAPPDFLKFSPERPAVLVVFPESAAFDNYSVNAFSAALVHNVRDCSGRGQNDCKVDGVCNVIHRTVDLTPEEHPAVRSDQMNLSGEPEFQQIFGDLFPQIGWSWGHADNHHR